MVKLEIIWTNQAKDSLQKIYDYYKEKSLQGARNVKSDLLQNLRQFTTLNNIKLMKSILSTEEL